MKYVLHILEGCTFYKLLVSSSAVVLLPLVLVVFAVAVHFCSKNLWNICAAVVFLLPATLIMEKNVVGITLALAREDIKIIWYLLFNSALAYFVNLTNFLVTKHTSALTLQVLGNAKGAVAVVVSILIFRNPVSVTGMLGYSLTVFGVILYSEAKKRSK
ncbi:hypothetical protein Q3G72_033493 [Acer saccharum]|nr:hypothetical protein Q3G72_033493 [Acer saccharum]